MISILLEFVHDWALPVSGKGSSYSAPQQVRFSSCIGGHFTEP
jgi:hypothetical protein